MCALYRICTHGKSHCLIVLHLRTNHVAKVVLRPGAFDWYCLVLRTMSGAPRIFGSSFERQTQVALLNSPVKNINVSFPFLYPLVGESFATFRAYVHSNCPAAQLHAWCTLNCPAASSRAASQNRPPKARFLRTKLLRARCKQARTVFCYLRTTQTYSRTISPPAHAPRWTSRAFKRRDGTETLRLAARQKKGCGQWRLLHMHGTPREMQARNSSPCTLQRTHHTPSTAPLTMIPILPCVHASGAVVTVRPKK